MHYESTDSYIYGGRQYGAKISGFEFYYVCKKI
jgi:phosphosulfolactate phosphohydrolase-like enzyme